MSMALDTAAQWEAQAPDWMLAKLRSDAPPDTFAQCRREEDWSALYRFFAERNFTSENIDFLDAVDAYRQSPDSDVAKKIYDDYVRSGVLNLFSRAPLDEMLNEEVLLTSQDMFDQAFEEIYQLTNQDAYEKFKRRAATIQQQLAESDTGEAEPDLDAIEVSEPQAVEFTRDMIDQTVVDNYNEQALKDMDEGSDSTFYQLGDLVVILGYGATEAQPYVKWLREQDGLARGNITMTKKGAMFDPGTITVEGGGDRSAIETAIRRISKKKVKFE